LPNSQLQEMTLEHYPGMTEKALEAIVEQASQRWDLQNCAIIHRVGSLKPSDQNCTGQRFIYPSKRCFFSL